MKIFWSWQSDTPGKTGRHFIRGVIEDALTQLALGDELDEPVRENLHLDHDRKGVPGSPDLAQTILEKIRDSAVFVADVTLVGKADKGKPLINYNVAIELGYAISFVGDDGLLMVLNEAYGERESLPFDLRHKAGPITYKLSDNSSKEEIKRVHAQLVGNFKTALRDCLNAKRGSIESTLQNLHDEIPSIGSCAEYFEPDEILGKFKVGGIVDDALRYRSCALIYLRIIPKEAMDRLKDPVISDLIRSFKVSPLPVGMACKASHMRNKNGGMTFSYIVEDKSVSILASTQIFWNRELWGINSALLDGGKYIPGPSCEHVLREGLFNLCQLRGETVGIQMPFYC